MYFFDVAEILDEITKAKFVKPTPIQVHVGISLHKLLY